MRGGDCDNGDDDDRLRGFCAGVCCFDIGKGRQASAPKT
jgi:hypothetical protein